MDKALLVGPGLEGGHRFVDVLVKTGVPVRAALWHKPPLADWRLSVVTPARDSEGLEKLFERTREVFENTEPRLELDENDIYFLGAKTNFAKSLRNQCSGIKNRATTIYDLEGDAHEAFVYFAK
ncbi:MAG: hypothetical protein FJW38_11560 [Acidobacteria bacterium]|nr:hypothetical protein [Acidobacteriota bacterium]